MLLLWSKDRKLLKNKIGNKVLCQDTTLTNKMIVSSTQLDMYCYLREHSSPQVSKRYNYCCYRPSRCGGGGVA